MTKSRVLCLYKTQKMKIKLLYCTMRGCLVIAIVCTVVLQPQWSHSAAPPLPNEELLKYQENLLEIFRKIKKCSGGFNDSFENELLRYAKAWKLIGKQPLNPEFKCFYECWAQNEAKNLHDFNIYSEDRSPPYVNRVAQLTYECLDKVLPVTGESSECERGISSLECLVEAQKASKE